MLRKLFMTVISIKHDTDLHLDIVQTFDLNAFHSHDSFTLTDKKENKICQRFAFLKISKIRIAAHLPAPAHGLTPTQAKELQFFEY